ncbi:MAG TPA: hypothetical protein VLK84_24070 [Longimicrobium sp.]|nr:hypothetical protein [Longimicrobium sp.]
MTRLNSNSFLRGFGRVLDVRGAFTPRESRKPAWIQNDDNAVAADWAAVFGDLSEAYCRVRAMNGSD